MFPSDRALALIAAALTALPVFHASPETQAPDSIGHALVTEVYYDTFVSGEADEFARIANPTASAIDLSGWKLTDGEGILTFPAGATLAAGASIYVTARATAFRTDMIVSPQWEYLSDSDPTVPNLAKSGTFTLANTGDEVLLKDAAGNVVDAVAYGTSTYAGTGWSGDPATKVSEGVILKRAIDETTGERPDTDTAADWKHDRIYVAGQSDFTLASYTFNGAVTAYTSPDSSYAAVAAAFNATTTTIDLNMYEITNVHLGDVLLARAQAGVRERILMEGTPAGMAQVDHYQENWILKRLVDAGAEVRFIVTNATQGIHDRYDYMHAKYAVLDGARALVESGNFKYTGVPVDATTGNREWGIVVENAGVASYLEQVFADDYSHAHRDVLDFGAGTDWRYLPPPPAFTPDATVPTGTYEHPYPSQRITGEFTITPVLVPDTDLLRESGIVSRISHAQSEILIEQMYAHKHWGTQNDTVDTAPNVFLEAALDAARARGVHVYVLLGDEYIDEEDTRNNRETVDYVNGLRLDEGLPVYARIVDHRIANLTKIHNKGVVIDGETAFVASINWGEASAKKNREVGLIVDNADVAQFYANVFWYDWSPKDRVPPADLTITDVRYEPDALLAAAGIPDPAHGRVLVTVANVGPHEARNFNVSANATPSWIGDVVALDAAHVDALAAGANVTLSYPLDSLARIGRWTFQAYADPEARVLELAEDNNAFAAAGNLLLDVPGIDARAFAAEPGAPALPPT